MKNNTKRVLLKLYFKLKYKSKLSIGSNVWIAKNSKFFGKNRIHDNVIFNGIMNGGSYIGRHSEIYGNIGKYSSIGESVKVLIATHPIDHVSTSPVFYSTALQAGYTLSDNQNFNEYLFVDTVNKIGIDIGPDVWIGSCVTIIGGVTIGTGSIILANAVVTKDVEPYSIMGGIPAKRLKYRFEKDQIEFLVNFEWWNKSETWLKDNLNLFGDLPGFIKEHNKT